MKVLIIFGSEVGTTKYVAEVMASQLKTLGNEVKLYHVGMNGFQPPLEDAEMVLVGSPTYYGGNLEQKMDRLVLEFKPDLSKYVIGVFSLGDSAFEHFCGSAALLEKWVTGCGGTLAVPTLLVDGYPRDTEPIKEWINQLCNR